MATRTETVPNTSDTIYGTSQFVPMIDLNNFEDPQYENGKYVLTSPRSLEACSRLSVKPVDLLYKPLAEFQEELLPQDVPLRTIFNIYDEHEQERKRKVQMCRDERYRIIAEEPRKPQMTGSSVRINTGGNYDRGSLQRHRTAWTTSVGHKRITAEDIEDRANELHHESLKLKYELLSRKERQEKKRKPSGNKSASQNVTPSALQTSASNISQKSNTSTRSTRSKINTTMTTPVKIPETDKKIVELMKSKRLSERRFYNQRLQAHLAWAKEREEEEKLQEEIEMRRRYFMAEEKRIRSMKQREKERRQKRMEEEMQKEKEVSVLDSSRQWESGYQRQLQMKAKAMTEKKERDELRKRIQALNLKEAEYDQGKISDVVKSQSVENLKMAEQRKEVKAHMERMRKLLENHKERESFEKRQNQIERLSREDDDTLRCSVDLKHHSANANVKKMKEEKYHSLMLNQSKREQRLEHARESMEKMDTEMEQWRHALIHRRKVMERQASASAERNIKERAQRVHEERMAREKEHKVNIKRVQKELEKYERGLRDDIKLKNKKSQMLQEEKDALISQTRAVADASQKLRDEVRYKYDNETIADKSLHAELYNKMGLGIESAVRNASSVQFK